MATIYHGKAQSVKIDADGNFAAAAEDLGYSKVVKIMFEPEVAELMPGDLQVGGYVSYEIDIAETGDTNEAIVETFENTSCYLQIEDPALNTYKIGPMNLRVGLERDFSDPKNPHVYKLRGRKYAATASALITGPTAPS